MYLIGNRPIIRRRLSAGWSSAIALSVHLYIISQNHPHTIHSARHIHQRLQMFPVNTGC